MDYQHNKYQCKSSSYPNKSTIKSTINPPSNPLDHHKSTETASDIHSVLGGAAGKICAPASAAVWLVASAICRSMAWVNQTWANDAQISWDFPMRSLWKPHQKIEKVKTGWWLSLLPWKIWLRQPGWWHSQLNGKIKFMFQATNQKSFQYFRIG